MEQLLHIFYDILRMHLVEIYYIEIMVTLTCKHFTEGNWLTKESLTEEMVEGQKT